MNSSRIVLPAALIVLGLFSPPSWAQVVDDPTVHAQNHQFWINGGNYKSPADGTHCCGKNDCHLVRADGVRITAAGYRLIDGQTIPYAETLTSEDGDYWMCKRHDGSRRCFFAPQPSS
jgi:hypothetical protein